MTIIELLGNDWLGVTLNCVKIVGVIVTGFAGIVATTPDKPKREEKLPPKTPVGKFLRKVFSKKQALRWAVIGLVVTLLSQIGDTVKSSLDNKEAQSEFSEQMAVATNSLNELKQQDVVTRNTLEGIQRVISRFDNLSVDLCFELPETNAIVADLRNYCNQCINDPNNAVIYSKTFTIDHGFYISPPDAEGETNRFSFDIQSLISDYTEDVPGIKNITMLLSSLMEPQLAIGLNKGRRSAQTIDSFASRLQSGELTTLWYNLELRSSLKNTNLSLYYALPSGRLAVVWHNFNWPKSEWRSDYTICSLHDLDSVFLYLSFSPGKRDERRQDIRDIYNGMRLKWTILYIDNYAVTLDDTGFRQVQNSPENILPNLLEAPLPPESEIVSGAALKLSATYP